LAECRLERLPLLQFQHQRCIRTQVRCKPGVVRRERAEEALNLLIEMSGFRCVNDGDRGGNGVPVQAAADLAGIPNDPAVDVERRRSGRWRIA
jgi:hypothetical protein